MALGDCLAVALMRRRGFSAESLAFVHAGGLIGRQAARRVADLMHSGEALPAVGEAATLREALVEILKKKLGMTTVRQADGALAGVLTDGDLKRILLSDAGTAALEQPVGRFMTRTPRTIDREASVAAAVRVMEDPARGFITALVVVDGTGRAEGVLHLHDCLRPA
jgi:arabinose-5-phosphate isomerase